MLTADESQKLKKLLEEAGCCPRCILRHFGERNFTVYFDKETVLAEIKKKCSPKHTDKHELSTTVVQSKTAEEQTQDGDDPSAVVSPPKRKLLNPCTICLDVLQTGCDSHTIQTIIDTVQNSSCQFRSFVLQLSMPPSVELRETLMELYLKKEHSEMYSKFSQMDIPNVRDAWKFSVGPLVANHFKADCSPKSAFSISVKMNHPDLEAECKPLQTLSGFTNVNGKNKTLEEIYTRSSVTRAIQKNYDSLNSLYALPPQIATSPVIVDHVSCSHQPIYFAGRYNKYSRELSQTPWVVDGEKRLVSSVEERIVEVVAKHILYDKIVFSSSGREDVDVRMLGNGRPFVLELLNPRTTSPSREFMLNLQNAINESTSDIAVNDLQLVSKDDLQNLKEGEEEKRKKYCALCCISRPLTSFDLDKISKLTDLEVLQKTPMRVLHRRTQAVRKRVVFNMSLEARDNQTFVLYLETQAGTYVKEFVHGDFGRTKPSLGDILNAETDIIELDVERVELDWPPPLK